MKVVRESAILAICAVRIKRKMAVSVFAARVNLWISTFKKAEKLKIPSVASAFVMVWWQTSVFRKFKKTAMSKKCWLPRAMR